MLIRSDLPRHCSVARYRRIWAESPDEGGSWAIRRGCGPPAPGPGGVSPPCPRAMHVKRRGGTTDMGRACSSGRTPATAAGVRGSRSWADPRVPRRRRRSRAGGRDPRGPVAPPPTVTRVEADRQAATTASWPSFLHGADLGRDRIEEGWHVERTTGGCPVRHARTHGAARSPSRLWGRRWRSRSRGVTTTVGAALPRPCVALRCRPRMDGRRLGLAPAKPPRRRGRCRASGVGDASSRAARVSGGLGWGKAAAAEVPRRPLSDGLRRSFPPATSAGSAPSGFGDEGS